MAVLAGALVFVLARGEQHASGTTLALSFKPGQVYRFHLVNRITGTISSDGAGLNAPIDVGADETVAFRVISVDRDGIITLAEGRGLESLGLEPGQHVGQSVFDLYQATPAVAENIRRALRGEEFTALIQVGEVAFDAHYAPLRDAAGEITGVLGVATDVTRSRRAAAQPPLDAAA